MIAFSFRYLVVAFLGVLVTASPGNRTDDVVDETHLHISDKNVPHDPNRPDFGHDHTFVNADMYIYAHHEQHHLYEGGCEKKEINVGSCVLGGEKVNGKVRTDHHQKFLCDYDTKEIYISHCKKEDCTHCTEPELNHFGYEHDKCRFGFRKIKCTDNVWLGCVVGHSKHTLPRHVCGDKDIERMHEEEDDALIEVPEHRAHDHKLMKHKHHALNRRHHGSDYFRREHPNGEL